MILNEFALNTVMINKKLVSILLIITGTSMVFLPRIFIIIGACSVIYGIKLFNDHFIENTFHCKRNSIRPNIWNRRLYAVFILPAVFIMGLVYIVNPSPVYKALSLMFTLPFVIITAMIMRYNAVTGLEESAVVKVYFDKRLSEAKLTMALGILLALISAITLIGLSIFAFGFTKYFTVKILLQNNPAR
ncbi:MAG: hypothetical protein V1859_02215 [archaeon]